MSKGRCRGANVGHVKDIPEHEDLARPQGSVMLAVADLKNAVAKVHPRERS